MNNVNRVQFVRDAINDLRSFVNTTYHNDRCDRALEKLDSIEEELRRLRVREINDIWYGNQEPMQVVIGRMIQDDAGDGDKSDGVPVQPMDEKDTERLPGLPKRVLR